MKVIFANVTHGFVYAQDIQKPESMLFKKFSIPDYVEYFQKNNADIICLSEALIDDEGGNSEFVKAISEATGLKHTKVLRSESSWIYIGKHYGMAILSRYPITSYEEFKLPNPNFEVIRPNGEHWKMHDKYAQFATLDINGKELDIFNLHYFPVHHFKKTIDSEEMKPYREALSEIFISKGFNKPTIITGDFNNKGSKLKDVFPELFDSGTIKEAIEAETTILYGNDQLDHILFTHKILDLKQSKTEIFLSDHYSLIAEFK